MINSNRLQDAYIDLYVQMRKYIWDLDVVTILATLETETYKSFPDLKYLTDVLTKLKNSVIDTYRDDEEFKSAFDKFFDLLKDNTSDEIYKNLKTFKEV